MKTFGSALIEIREVQDMLTMPPKASSWRRTWEALVTGLRSTGCRSRAIGTSPPSPPRTDGRLEVAPLKSVVTSGPCQQRRLVEEEVEWVPMPRMGPEAVLTYLERWQGRWQGLPRSRDLVGAIQSHQRSCDMSEQHGRGGLCLYVLERVAVPKPARQRELARRSNAS